MFFQVINIIATLLNIDRFVFITRMVKGNWERRVELAAQRREERKGYKAVRLNTLVVSKLHFLSFEV
jgi:hypothetical protein